MTAPKFDVDDLVAECQAAAATDEPLPATRDVLARMLDRRSLVADVLGRDEGGLETLFASDELTILNAVWAPGMLLQPHDHRMWAAIGVYAGVEDNEFFRRNGAGIAESGGKAVPEGEVLLLGDDVIHRVRNSTNRLTGAIHVYGGDFFNTPRSEWDPETFEEHAWSTEHTLAQFAEANARYRDTRV